MILMINILLAKFIFLNYHNLKKKSDTMWGIFFSFVNGIMEQRNKKTTLV